VSVRATFSIHIERDRDLVKIAMSGFFGHHDIRGFLEARNKAHEQLACAPQAHLTLNDIRGMTAQPQTIVDAFHEMLAAPEYRSRRLAFVVGPTLARSQVLRALAAREARCFTDPVAAEAWLFAAEEDAAPPRRAAG
jgi:hypothetical protein